MVKLNTQKHCVIELDLNHIYFELFWFSKKIFSYVFSFAFGNRL